MTYIEFLEKVLEKVEYATKEELFIFTCHMIENTAFHAGDWDHADCATNYINNFLEAHCSYPWEHTTYAGILGRNRMHGFDPVVAHFQIYMLKRMIGEAKCKNWMN